MGAVSLVVDYADGGRRRAVSRLRRDAAAAARSVPRNSVRPSVWRGALAETTDALAEAVGRPSIRGERSRALFASVGSPDVTTLASPVLLPEVFAIDPEPRLAELVIAEVAAGIRGVIGVTRRRVSAYEFWGPHPHGEWTIPVEPERGSPRRREGPGRGGPRRAVVHQNRVQRRTREITRRVLADAAGDVASLALSRGWRVAVVGGDMREIGHVLETVQSTGLTAVPHGRHVDSHAERVAALETAHVEERRHARARLDAHGARVVRGPGLVADALERGIVTEVVVGVGAASGGSAPVCPSSLLGAEGVRMIRGALTRDVGIVPLDDSAAAGVPEGAVVAMLESGARGPGSGAPPPWGLGRAAAGMESAR